VRTPARRHPPREDSTWSPPAPADDAVPEQHPPPDTRQDKRDGPQGTPVRKTLDGDIFLTPSDFHATRAAGTAVPATPPRRVARGRHHHEVAV